MQHLIYVSALEMSFFR